MLKFIKNCSRVKLYTAVVLTTLVSSVFLLTVFTRADDTIDPDRIEKLPYEEIELFSVVYETIKRAYVSDVDDETLVRYAISGMLSNLDPHSAFLDEKDTQALSEQTSGEYAGLGIQLSMEDGLVRVISPFDGSPAKRVGIMSGDLIFKIDDTLVRGLDIDQAISLMRGRPGTSVNLSILRRSTNESLVFNVTREVIKLKSTSSRMIDDDYMYLRVSQFAERTASEARDIIDKAMEEQEIKGVVLDLRNNPGGLLNSSVDVANLFLPQGTLVVSVKGREENLAELRTSYNNAIPENIPLVVLVNNGSASASEIVAGAIQDHKRGIVMGKQTFGKGSVQSLIQLREQVSLRITTALYYTPLGISIQATGIKPDIDVDTGTVDLDTATNEDLQVREIDLQGHIENPSGNDNNSSNSDEIVIDNESSTDIRDYQLSQAVNLLKALYIIQN